MAFGVEELCILLCSSKEYFSIDRHDDQCLDRERIEEGLDYLWQIVNPIEAGVAQEVLKVVRVPSCILPVDDGQFEIRFPAWELWAKLFDHDVLFLYIAMCESRGMTGE